MVQLEILIILKIFIINHFWYLSSPDESVSSLGMKIGSDSLNKASVQTKVPEQFSPHMSGGSKFGLNWPQSPVSWAQLYLMNLTYELDFHFCWCIMHLRGSMCVWACVCVSLSRMVTPLVLLCFYIFYLISPLRKGVNLFHSPLGYKKHALQGDTTIESVAVLW